MPVWGRRLRLPVLEDVRHHLHALLVGLHVSDPVARDEDELVFPLVAVLHDDVGDGGYFLLHNCE